MTTGRINQVARKVGTHATPEGDTRAQTLGQAQRETAHATRSLSPRILSSSRTDRQCIFRAARTQRHERHRQPSCRHRPNEFGGDLRHARSEDQNAPLRQLQTPRVNEDTGASHATSLHSKVPMLSAQTAQPTHCERRTGKIERDECRRDENLANEQRGSCAADTGSAAA